MKHISWKGTSVIIIIALLLAGLALFSSCTDNTSNANIATASVTFRPTNHMVITIDFDDAPEGYNQGNIVDVYFTGDRFQLTDKYGNFNGDWTWNSSDNELTLDFDSYPAWYMTLNANGSFSGSENDYADGGTYQWS